MPIRTLRALRRLPVHLEPAKCRFGLLVEEGYHNHDEEDDNDGGADDDHDEDEAERNTRKMLSPSHV